MVVYALQVSISAWSTNGDSPLTAGRNNEGFIKTHRKRKAFLKGGNLFCRFHICQHYKVYKERCEKEDILINHWVIPQPIWKAMEEEKEKDKRGRETKKHKQQQLDFKAIMVLTNSQEQVFSMQSQGSLWLTIK